MSKRQRRSGSSKHVTPPEEGIAPGLAPQSPAPNWELPDLRKQPEVSGGANWLIGMVAGGSLACAIVGLLGYAFWIIQRPALVPVPAGMTTPFPPPWVPQTAEDQLVDRFVRLKNARDPEAAALLGPVPVVPEHPQRKAEAEALQAQFFLGDDLRIVEVRRYSDLPDRLGEPGAQTTYILVTQGNVSAPRLTIWKNDQETESSQRTMSNPDIHLRVVEGKIVLLRPELHTD